MNDQAMLEVSHLATAFDIEAGRVRAVDDVSFQVHRGKTLGIVGESGCGKSVTALSIMRLLPRPAGKILDGRILYRGTDIVKMTPETMRTIRGRHISMIFQEPMTALNPVHRIGRQIGEVFQLHDATRDETRIRDKSVEMLAKVGIPDPERRIREYSHQISGGMRQRVMIAMALAVRPDILIADEPTTALDVTIQAQILDLMKQLQQENGMAMIFITHDLGVIADICDDVVVMYAGTVVESAPVRELFENPRHPYTRGLLESIPRLETPRKISLPIIRGMVPTLDNLPPGCRFQNRCPIAIPICESVPPGLTPVGNRHEARCYLA
ncbi:MAG: ABC transporter ATP-binding protein [Deltaproteobacteria bacterium]|nr:ABC transporter ATP-binding protein [Deltaproteobacteria bacterium]